MLFSYNFTTIILVILLTSRLYSAPASAAPNRNAPQQNSVFAGARYCDRVEKESATVVVVVVVVVVVMVVVVVI